MKAKFIWDTFTVVFSMIGGAFGWWVGGLDGLIYALITFAVVDYITGVFRAAVEKKLSSRIGAKGIIKKVVIFLIVGVANITDLYLIGGGSALRTAVICFYSANEGLSLLENTVAIGLPVPEKLKKALIQLRNKSENEQSEEDGKEE